jgi:hypothetical protein
MMPLLCQKKMRAIVLETTEFLKSEEKSEQRIYWFTRVALAIHAVVLGICYLSI